MKKYTKREHNKRIQILDNTALSIVIRLNNLNSKIEAEGITPAATDEFNHLHDLQWKIERAYGYLESKWSRRNWTHAHYSSFALIQQNID